MKFRFYLSLFIAKIIYKILKITKLSSGTAIIGLITLKICPDFLTFANNHILKSQINITGTNGKTTSSGVLAHIIKKNNYSLFYNDIGANMLNGIVNALALQIKPAKKADYSVIETDEAFLEKVYEKLNSDYLLVTNLFEDQTDRFANPLFTKNLIQKAIDKKPNIQLILNADEPISASLKALNKEPIYYGIENIYDENNNLIITENLNYECPICKKQMNYSKTFYSQIGHYSCSCGYNRPLPKYSANIYLNKNNSIIKINEEDFEIPLIGLFNAYNALSAIVLAKELGLINIKEAIKDFKVAFGRCEKRILNGNETIIQLIKNPVGTNEVLKTIDLNSNFLIALNNNAADGTDVSWINQVEFERLSSSTKEFVVTGLKCDDMAIRLSNAGIKNIKKISDINSALKYVGENSHGKITILTTYTALLKIDKNKEMKKCF